MELLGGLIAAGLVAAAPAVPGLRSVAKAVMKGGMAVADATVAVTMVVTHQVGDLVTHVRSADAGETIVDAETEASSPDAQVADSQETTPTAEAPADLSSASASSASGPSLRPVAKAAVKGGMALANTAKGAAGAAVGAAALTGQQLGGLALRVSPKKTAADTIPASDESQADSVDAATGQAGEEVQPAPAPLQSGDASSATPETDQFQPSTGDDLVRIGGIGPKVASLLQEDGISSFAELAATPVEHLREILNRAGARYRVTDPSSWPAQAQALMDAPEPAQIQAFDEYDLVQINGIGPKIASLLQEAGITNLTDLAAKPVERLREILDQSGARYRVTDPSSWPYQAQALLDANK